MDAFTTRAFAGNPAAVVLIPPSARRLPDEVLQSIAAENNLSNTGYVEIPEGEDATFESGRNFNLRWFTPKMEVPLCGHATLSSAAVLWSGVCWTAAVWHGGWGRHASATHGIDA